MARAKAKYTIEAEDRTGRGLDAAEGRLRRFGRLIATGVGAAVAAIGSALVAWSSAIVAAGEKLVDLKAQAEDIRATVEDMAAIEMFADEQDVEVGQVVSGIERLQERIGEAIAKEETALKLFKEINVEVDKLAQLSPLAALVTTGAAIERIDPARRTKLQAELVGGGTGRIFGGDFIGAAERAGAAVPEGLTGAATTFDRMQDAVERMWDRAGYQLGASFGNSAFAIRIADFLEAQAQDRWGPLGVATQPTGQTEATERLVTEMQFLRQNIAKLNNGTIED